MVTTLGFSITSAIKDTGLSVLKTGAAAGLKAGSAAGIDKILGTGGG